MANEARISQADEAHESSADDGVIIMRNVIGFPGPNTPAHAVPRTARQVGALGLRVEAITAQVVTGLPEEHQSPAAVVAARRTASVVYGLEPLQPEQPRTITGEPDTPAAMDAIEAMLPGQMEHLGRGRHFPLPRAESGDEHRSVSPEFVLQSVIAAAVKEGYNQALHDLSAVRGEQL